MKLLLPIVTFLIISFVNKAVFADAVSDTESLIVSGAESSKEKKDASENDSIINPQIYSMQLQTNISNRFATTLITSKVKNLKTVAAETTFSVIIPENAFISAFEMEINEKIYKAYVKEKEEAKQIYQQAVSHGQSAAHVELNARDSKKFTVSVNIEPESKTIFRLTYEELLQRQNGQYELILNIRPGQIVKDLGVEVQISESRPLTFVRTPSLRTGNEISKNNENLDPSSTINIINETSALVKFDPDEKQQKLIAENLGSGKEKGIAGQFVVQYDVQRDSRGGEVLIRDGYFVHFFAPSELKPLLKHVVFVLDHSGSMLGRKIEQLTEAVKNILSEIRSDDVFNIVRFSEVASIWNPDENKFQSVRPKSPFYGHLTSELKEMNLPQAVPGTKENINKAKSAIIDTGDTGLTNIIAGLEIGLFLTQQTQEKEPNKYQPMIIFLTDGQANVGIRSQSTITEIVTRLNSDEPKVAIFSLSFGEGADKEFLQKLSSKNLGFSRHIYEAADSSLQLQDFYKTISSPLLTNVSFKYVDGVIEVTKHKYPILFNGSELVVAGKTGDNSHILLGVDGQCTVGPVTFNASIVERTASLERLWAYLTVKQVLKEREVADNKTELTKKALDLALKYSFVTSVSSLVVTKPNGTDTTDAQKVRPHTAQDNIRPRYGWRSLKPSPIIGGGRFLLRGPPGIPRPTSLEDNSGIGIRRPLSLDGVKGSKPNFGPPGTGFHKSITVPPSSFTIPAWLQLLKSQNENVTISGEIYKLGDRGTVTNHPECPKSPTNGLKGQCTIIFDCPEVFPVLTDFNYYLNYFCPLDEYAGVCCPDKNVPVP